MIGCLLRAEGEREYELAAEEWERYKAQIAAINWDVYDAMFGSKREETQRQAREEAVEWAVPETQGELYEVAKALGLSMPDDA